MSADSSEIAVCGSPNIEEEWRAYGALMALAALAGVTHRPGFTPESDAQQHEAQQHVFVYAERYLRDWHAKSVPEADRANAARLALVSVADIAELATTVQRTAFKVLDGWGPVDPDQGRIDISSRWEWEATAAFPAPERWRGLVFFGLRVTDFGRVLDLAAGPMLQADAILATILEMLGEVGGAGVMRKAAVEPRWRRWLQEPGGPLAAAKLLVLEAAWARILAERERATEEAEAREERRRKVPVPSMSGLMAAAVAGLGRQGDTPTLRGQAAGIVAYEPGAWLDLADADGDTAGVLAAWLARVAHRQWLEGVGKPDRVEVIASRESLKAMGLGGDTSRAPADVLEAALSLLASTRLMGADDDKQKGTGRLVLDYFKADKRAPSDKGGRPSPVYVVTLGWPLIPTQLEALAAERGFTVPRELVWYGPVLEPAWAPLTGNTRTQRTQRLAFAVGAGQWLVSRREEYADLGGVRLDTLRGFLQSMGLYHRSHASLADDVADQWRSTPPQPKLPGFGPKGPLLVPTKVDGVYRLGPDYKAQEALVIRNAEVTTKARAKQRRGKAKP